MKARLLCALVSVMAMAVGVHAQAIRVHARLITRAAVRIEPNPARTPLTTLAPGTVVTVTGVEGAWLSIEFDDDRYGKRFGYIVRTAVNLPTTQPSQPAERPKPQTQAPARPAAPPSAEARPAEGNRGSAEASSRPVESSKPVEATSRIPEAAARDGEAGSKPAEPGKPLEVTGRFPEAAKAGSRQVDASKPVEITGKFPEAAKAGSRQVDASKPVEITGKFPDAGAGSVKAVSRPAESKPVEITGKFPEARIVSAEPTVEPARTPGPALSKASSVATPEAASPEPAEATTSSPAMPGRSAPAGRQPVAPKKGMPVTLMIPRGLLKEDGYLPGRRVPILTADIVGSTGKPLSVNGRADWMLAGLPSLVEASVEKVSRTKNYTELELRANEVAVKLRFANGVDDPEATLGQLVAEGGRDTAAAVRYRDEAHAALARTFFPGDLGEERRLAILASLQSSAGSPDIQLRGNQLYASFDLGVDEKVYDDLKFDQAFIVAHVLNETVLTRVRELSKSLPDEPELVGMRLLYRIPHKHEKRVPPQEYRVEIITSREHAAMFAASEITAQEFLDSSALTVDGKSVQVPLAPAAQ